MKRFVLPLLLSPCLLAQGPAITTTTGYGAIADLAGTVDFDAVATGTPVGFALTVRAREGSPMGGGDVASASTRVERAGWFGLGRGVVVRERGFVRNADPQQGASAGTSADAPSSTSPTQGAHSLSLDYPGIGQGTNAIVTIRWNGNASAGASCTSDVDVDGDGTPDFSATANGTPAGATLQVTAGANGVTIDVTTDGFASLPADGQEHYAASLSVYVREGTLPSSCTFTNFGASCGADLDGTVGPNLGLALDVSNAAADAFGFMIIGDQLATPIPAPLGSCNILVDRMGWGRGSFRLFRTDANGDATIGLRTPRRPVTISYQALILRLDPATGTRTLDTSNGTELVCQ